MKTPLLTPSGSPSVSKSSSPSPFSSSSTSGHHHLHSHHYASHRISRSFILTLAIGITFGFSFAYLLLSVVSWERVDLIDNRPSSNYLSSQRLHARESDTHDTHDDTHVHNDLEGFVTGPQDVFHPNDDNDHRGKIFFFILFHATMNEFCFATFS